MNLPSIFETLLKLRDEGRTRSIGVANFNVALLKTVVEQIKAPIACNQVEYHVMLDQTPVRRYLAAKSIPLVAYCPLAQGKVASDPTLAAIGRKHGASAVSARSRRRPQRKWPLAGPLLCQPSIGFWRSVHVVAMPDDHHPVGMAMTHAFVPAVIAMLAEFGARAVVMTAVPDHDGFGAGDRGCCDGDRAQGGNDVSKLLHDVLLH
jgi:Aldo/keto reductase family